MLEMGTSSLMSGEGKPPAASRSRPSALPRLYVRPKGADRQETRCLLPSLGQPHCQILVFYEPATHLFHRDDGRLLGRRRQHRVRAALQLAGPLGGHDDETVSALLRVVRNRAVRVIARNLVAHAWKILYFLK